MKIHPLVFGYLLLISLLPCCVAASPAQADPKESIASNRLGDEQVALLHAAARVDATRVPTHFETDSAPALGTGTNSGLQQGKVLPAELTALLLDDRLYVDNARSPFVPVVLFHIFATPPDVRAYGAQTVAPYLQIDIAPDTQTLCVTAPFAKREHYPSALYLNYTRLAGPMTALLKRAYPDDPYIQKLTPHPPLAEAVPAAISLTFRRQIASLHPGMTRADLLRLFTTEGGLYSRFQRTYIYRGPTQSEDLTGFDLLGGFYHPRRALSQPAVPTTKVNVEFLPHSAKIKWVQGIGLLVSPEEERSFTDEEKPDDIIVRISKPYLAPFYYD